MTKKPGKRAVYRSAATAVALAWSLRLIGLVSVVVLARLLSPRDFGIIALATAVMALVDMFSMIGLRQSLIRIDEPQRAHLDTAWTIQLILMTVLAALLALAAPAAATFFDEPALTLVIVAMSLRLVFLGFVNIGIVDFDRNMEFGRDMRMRLTVRLLGLVGTVMAAVLLRSYWALVIGVVLQSALQAAASYLFHPYRPRLSLSKRSELLDVSWWMFLGSAAQVFHHQVERLAIGKFSPVPQVGLYSVSKDLSSIFTLEIATALNRVTFVTTARGSRPLNEQPGRISAMLGAYAMIAAPAGFGIAAVSPEAIAVIFGDKWLPAAPLLQLIAPAAALYAVHKLIASTLQASGMLRGAVALSGGAAVLSGMALFATGFAGGDALDLAFTALMMSAATLAGGLLAIAVVAETSVARLLAAVGRPFAAAMAMFMAVQWFDPNIGLAIIDLSIMAAFGAAVFAAMLFGLWALCGRPAGAETDAFKLLLRLARGKS